MKIIKLIYTDHDSAIADLLAKGILINTTDLQGNEVVTYSQSTHAVVHIGLIVDTPAVVENMEVIKEATYLKGWHVDIMTDLDIKFDNAVEPKNPKHGFAGYQVGEVLPFEPDFLK
jgi:hypothetical protein